MKNIKERLNCYVNHNKITVKWDGYNEIENKQVQKVGYKTADTKLKGLHWYKIVNTMNTTQK